MATLTVREGRYWVLNWTDAAGTRHRPIIGLVGVVSEKQAKDILKAKQLELSTGAQLLGLSSPRAPTFGQYIADYLIWHQAEFPDSNYRTAQVIEQHLLPRFSYVVLDQIAPRMVEEMKRERRRKAKAHTVTKELRVLKAVLNRAVAERIIRENPIASVASPKILDAKPHFFYEADQLQEVYAACAEIVNNGKGPQPNPLHSAVYRLYANTGMRRGEGMYLKRQWVGYEGIKLVSTGEERTKAGTWREVPKTEGAAEALERLKSARVEGGYVLPRMTLPSLSRGFIRDARRAGLPGSIHSLRHTYISHLMRDTDTRIRTIQLFAGHASITTTEKYAYLRDKLGDTPAAALAL